jgi:hypothetical protein|tara:strand:- start:737 stop:2032 length:1296 start_codon:yes stop_codon:yes gene_type:complete
MKIHIIGAGPSGMSLAWEFLRAGNNDITIYDRKISAGGSWWEPDTESRDLHAHRIVFDEAFVNTQSLFSEMNIKWNDIFQPVDKKEYLHAAFKSIGVRDYTTIISLFSRVLARPDKYKGISLRDAVGTLSENGQNYIEHLPLIMDGVTWDVMSAYEFVKNIDHTSLSTMHTQKVSGKVMCDAMENCLLNNGINFVFGAEMTSIEYHSDGYSAKLSNGEIINDGMLFLCVDNSPALKLLGDNWGPDAEKKLRGSTYGAINVLIDYDRKPTLKTDLEIVSTTEWDLQPKVLFGTNTISCVICNLTENVLSSNPDMIKREVLKQLGLPEPVDIRIGWGAKWNGKSWDFSQSSGVLSLYGQLPFFGKCPTVAMCGMMSPRNTPYSSIEAAIEVSRSLSHEIFGSRKPLKPLPLSRFLLYTVLLLILIVLVLVYRR